MLILDLRKCVLKFQINVLIDHYVSSHEHTYSMLSWDVCNMQLKEKKVIFLVL